MDRLQKICILCFIFLCSSCEKEIEKSFRPTNNRIAEITKWMYDADVSISFTWDDANDTHFSTIAPLFDKYGYKATFFIQTNVLHDVRWNQRYINGYKSVLSNGHEIGSHTFQHISLKNLHDPDLINKQLKQSKEDIENYLGYKPISFCHPFNEFALDVDTLVDKYFLNSRYSSVKNVERRSVWTIMAGQNANDLKKQLVKLNSELNDWLIYAGHGVDGIGYSPANSTELDYFLNELKNYSEKNLWITTFGEASIYEYLSQHTTLKFTQDNSLLFIDYNMADERLNQLGITERILTIKINDPDNCRYVSAGIIDKKRKDDFVIITMDLTKSKEIEIQP